MLFRWLAACVQSAELSLLLNVGVVTGPAGFQPSMTAIAEAQKHAKYAASALGFEDVQTAVKNLSDALRLLTNP